MKYVLIDTCSLRHLIDNNAYSRYIIQLKNLINQNEIKLLVHENIINEWEKHKIKWRNDIERKLNFEKKRPVNAGNLPIISNDRIQYLDEQLATIDEILINGIRIMTPDVIKNESHTRIKERLAPFHKKIDSINDWEILGSTAVYCENHNISDLFFISNNYTDFGDEGTNKIHSSLSERFKKLNITYIKNIVDFFEESNFEVFPKMQILSFKILPDSRFSFESSLTNNVLTALDRIFNHTYKELGYIPIRILKNLYPFSNTKESTVYSDLFRLSNVNPDLVYFFKNIKSYKNGRIVFKDKSFVIGIKDYEKKTREALRNLRKNIIYHLDEHTTREVVDIEYHSSIKCCCYKCSYENLNFYKSLENLNTLIETNNKEKLRVAYYHYKLGNLSTAVDIYKEILSTSIGKKEYFIYLIAHYNLKNIAPLLNNYFRNHTIYDELIEELNEIDLYEIALRVKGHADYNFVQILVDESYFNFAFQRITALSKEIIEHYNMQLRGGWSSNSKVWLLISEYVKFQQFIKENCIICDEYDTYTKLFDSVLEGILASYALGIDQGGRITSIDNYWIGNIVFHSKRELLKQHIKRYKIKSLKLSENQNGQKYILQIATNLFKHYNKEQIGKKTDINNDFLHREISVFFDNLVILCSFLELDSLTINSLAKKILIFLRKENISNWHNIESIFFFIRIKKKLLLHNILLDYFNFFLTNNGWHSNYDIELLISCFKKDSLKEITTNQFNSLLEMSLDKCRDCGNNHGVEIVISLYDKVDKEKKSIIKDSILNSLKQRFVFDTFYLATLFDIIEFDEDILKDHLDNFQPSTGESVSFKSAFSESDDYILPYLNELLNLTFKFEFELNKNTIQKLKGVNIYYEWLLDLDNFDYNNFDPNWITLYQTRSFFKQMKKSKILKKKLINSIKGTSNTKVLEAFFKIYNNNH
ncbi:hypothetical protein CMT47_19555 [Elizabethkingia anophelis]|nr:hypothetical protein [Elizabethkingia anophelis]MDV4088322.1 hypothetical protein [Elizabethkingia anophelis]